MPTLRRSRVAGLDTAVLADWQGSLVEAHPRTDVRVLAWAPAADEVAIGSPGALSVGTAGRWRHLPWHTVERGGWNAEAGQLQWRTYDGGRGTVRLMPPRRLPELFRERVSATIAVEQAEPYPGSQGFTVSGRRDLTDDRAPLAWHVSLGRGLTWRTAGLEDATDRALDRLRREYDFG